MINRGGEEQPSPSHRVAMRNSHQEFLQAVGSNVGCVVITCLTFMGGTTLALFMAYCLWSGETPPNKGMPPLHGRGGFPYAKAFPKESPHAATIASIPYDLGNVYTGNKQQHIQQMHPAMSGQNFVSAHPQCIPPISTTRY